ncbi:MAG: M48 family metalloprotease [Rhodospirillales bacterium]|nr:M48 family metalloprotease [Rhodospirillales bacterium]
MIIAQKFLCRSLLILSVAIFPGCTVNPATGEQSFTAFMSPDKEREIGAEEHPKILKQFGGVYDDVEVSAYVAEIGFQLVKVSEMPDLAFRFTVLNDEKINAFALPGGYVYVTRGLIALAESEAELAGVIGHEIGHVTARHTAERYSSTMATNLGLTILNILGSVYGAPGEATQVLSAGAESILKGYSREQELEADMLGVRYVNRVGYDANAMTSVFRKLKGNDELHAAMEDRPTNEENFSHQSTHPRTTQRIEQAIQLASATTVADPIINRDRFLNTVDGIIFGDDPAQGIRKGRDFIHPDMRFKFTVPEGFVMYNSPSRVVARHKNKSAILFDMESSSRAKEFTDLKQYLTNEWGGKLGLEGVERIDVNGMETWTGNTIQSTNQGRRDVRLVVIRDGPDEIFRFAFLTPVDVLSSMETALKRTTYSVQRISEAEAQAVKPLRVRVLRADADVTADDLAATMDVHAFQKEWLELMNAGIDFSNLSDNTRIKIIQE